MGYVVGLKGQIVIAKEIRDKLGIKPGWLALQRQVGDHVAVYFVPQEHGKSLKGSLAEHTEVRVAPGQEWDEARKLAWNKAAEEKANMKERVS